MRQNWQNLKNMQKKHIIIFGVVETEKNYWDLEDIVVNILGKNLDLEFTYNDLEFSTRIGANGSIKRPIKIGLTSWRKKNS